MTNQTILDPPKQLGPNGTRSGPKARSRVWRDREAPNQAAVARAWRMLIPWFHGKKLGKIHVFLHVWPHKSSKHRGLTSDISWWFLDLWTHENTHLISPWLMDLCLVVQAKNIHRVSSIGCQSILGHTHQGPAGSRARQKGFALWIRVKIWMGD